MTDIWFYLLLGIIQGIVEWLPVSSQGILVAVQSQFGISSSLAFKVALWLHIGTLLAVLVYYRHEWKVIVTPSNKQVPLRRFLLLTTIGTAVSGIPIRLILRLFFDENGGLFSGFIYLIIGLALSLTSILLFLGQRQETTKDLQELTSIQEFFVGLAQGLSIIPGVSRSGITVSTLLFHKINGEDSFRGSFIISVPAVLGSTFLEIALAVIFSNDILTSIDFFGLFLGILLSLIIGIFTIHGLTHLAKRVNFSYLALALAIILIIAGTVQIFSLSLA